MKLVKLALASLVLLFWSCSGNPVKPYIQNQGFAQGTTYNIIYQDSTNFQKDIDSLLVAFDNSLSLYKEGSLICNINDGLTDSVDCWFTESFDLSKKVFTLSDGLFDPTLAPLIAAYGFARKEDRHVLEDTEREELMKLVGFDKVSVSDGKIIKADQRMKIDFNAIAQGLSVDVVSEFLENQGIKNYMVEIGGEIFSRGVSSRGTKWRIGIDSPVEGNIVSGADIANVIEISGRGLATSGNYRKFVDLPSGERITHTIDPRTGLSATHNLLSATIIAPSAAYADALATACMVGGLGWAKAFIEKIRENGERVDCYLIYSDNQGVMCDYTTMK